MVYYVNSTLIVLKQCSLLKIFLGGISLSMWVYLGWLCFLYFIIMLSDRPLFMSRKLSCITPLFYTLKTLV